MVWYFHFFKTFTQFVFIHTIKGFSVVYQSLVIVEGLAYLNEAMSHDMQRPTKMHESKWKVLTKHGPLEEGMATTLVFLS